MTVLSVLDAAGRRRSPATLPGYHAGRPPRNKGMRYPADPPTVEEIVAVMRNAPDDRHGWRVRAMIVVLWRAGLRVHEALALAEHDLDARRGSILVRHGKGGRRREVGMDEWAWEQLRLWLSARAQLPLGPLFCVIAGPTRGRPWSGAAVRGEFRRLAVLAGVRRRFAPHQLRHAHALELAREGVPLNIIQRQRPCQPRHHLDLPPRHRSRGNHHCSAHTAPADDVRQRRASALKQTTWSGSVSGRFRSALAKRAPFRRRSRQLRLVPSGRVSTRLRDARSSTEQRRYVRSPRVRPCSVSSKAVAAR
jgi:hypothetical protein